MTAPGLFFSLGSTGRSEPIEHRMRQAAVLSVASPRLIREGFGPQGRSDLLATKPSLKKRVERWAEPGGEGLNTPPPASPTPEQLANLAAVHSAAQGVQPNWSRLNPPLAFALRSDGTVAASRFGHAGGREPGLPDTDTAFYVLNGNNDEGYVRSAAKQLRGLTDATIIVSGFGGHATTDRFPVLGRRSGPAKTEADRFLEVLREEGVTAAIEVEPMATNSGENARNVGQHIERLLSRRRQAPTAVDVISFGIPAAAARQALSYAKQMRLPGIDVELRAGYIEDVGAYSTLADKLTTLRECSTLLRYAAVGGFVPTASEHPADGPFRGGLELLLDGMLSELGAFADRLDLEAAPDGVAGLRSAIGMLRATSVVSCIVGDGPLRPDQEEALSAVDGFLREAAEVALRPASVERAGARGADRP